MPYVRAPTVRYPYTMLNSGIEGFVVVGVLVGRDGKPANAWILRSSGYEAFDSEALAAAKSALWPSQPEEKAIGIPIRFTLRGPPVVPSPRWGTVPRAV